VRPERSRAALDRDGARDDPGLRLRVLVVAMLAAAVIGTGVVAEGMSPPRDRPVEIEAERSGAWFCPHGGSQAWKGWVVMTNPGRAAVRVRLTTFGSDTDPESSTLTVGPGSQVYREVAADEEAASTEVEYFGGWLAAAAILSTGGDAPAIGAGRCVAAPHEQWFLPDGTTSQGQTAYAVVMNPFSTDAAVDIILRTEERVIRPGSLSPLVVSAGRSEAIRLGEFALQGPRERTVAVEVNLKLGRVVVGGLGFGERAVRVEAGLPILHPRWSIPAAGAQEWMVPAFNPGQRQLTLSLVSQSGDAQELLPELSEVPLGPEGVQTISVPGAHNATVVTSLDGLPLAAAGRVTATGEDAATVNGAARPYHRWMVLPTQPPGEEGGLVVLENPGVDPARVTIELIGEGRVARSPPVPGVHIPAGRAVILRVPAGGGPMTVLVEATEGGIVAGGASISGSGSGYAATLGVPLG
jgi:hypothetical protein